MGHYIAARNARAYEEYAIKFGVWNPNVKLLYKSLKLKEPGPDDWSGEGNEIQFSHDDIRESLNRIEDAEFFQKVQYEELHPIVRPFTELQQPQLDVEEEKKRINRSLTACLKILRWKGR